jgi:hypothetical protein
VPVKLGNFREWSLCGFSGRKYEVLRRFRDRPISQGGTLKDGKTETWQLSVQGRTLADLESVVIICSMRLRCDGCDASIILR